MFNRKIWGQCECWCWPWLGICPSPRSVPRVPITVSAGSSTRCTHRPHGVPKSWPRAGGDPRVLLQRRVPLVRWGEQAWDRDWGLDHAGPSWCFGKASAGWAGGDAAGYL